MFRIKRGAAKVELKSRRPVNSDVRPLVFVDPARTEKFVKQSSGLDRLGLVASTGACLCAMDSD